MYMDEDHSDRRIWHYHEPNTQVESVAIMEVYHSLKWDHRKTHLEQFITTFKDITRRLEGAGVRDNDSMRTTKLLGLMPKELREITHKVMNGPPSEINVTSASIKLLAEYKYLQRQGSLLMSGKTRKIAADAALNAEEVGSRRDKSQDHCHKCGKIGNWARECRSDHNVKHRRDGGRGRGQRGGRGSHGGRGKNDAIDGDANANLAHGPEDFCFSLTEVDAETGASGSQGGRHIVLDSGASCHLTGDLRHLHEPTPCSRTVITASSHRMDVKIKGKMKLPSPSGGNIVLEGILSYSSFRHTLVSIPKITVDHPNMAVTFEQRKCIVMNKANPNQSLLVGQYDETSKLFLADTMPIEAAQEVSMAVMHGVGDSMEPTHNEIVLGVGPAAPKAAHARMSLAELTRLWHFRMGHLPVPTMAGASSRMMDCQTQWIHDSACVQAAPKPSWLKNRGPSSQPGSENWANSSTAT
ncbi:unnamed protein product [Aphanomyces euteiches]